VNIPKAVREFWAGEPAVKVYRCQWLPRLDSGRVDRKGGKQVGCGCLAESGLGSVRSPERIESGVEVSRADSGRIT
jgi:hypothetical protein